MPNALLGAIRQSCTLPVSRDTDPICSKQQKRPLPGNCLEYRLADCGKHQSQVVRVSEARNNNPVAWKQREEARGKNYSDGLLNVLAV